MDFLERYLLIKTILLLVVFYENLLLFSKVNAFGTNTRRDASLENSRENITLKERAVDKSSKVADDYYSYEEPKVDSSHNKTVSYDNVTTKVPRPSLGGVDDDYYDYKAQYGDTAKEMSYGRTTSAAPEVKRSRKPSHVETTLRASHDDYYDYEAQYGDTAKEMSYGRTTLKAPEVKRSRKPSHTETTLKAPNDDYYDYEAQYGDTAKEMSYGRTTVKAPEVKRSRKPSHTETTLKAPNDDYYDYEAQYGDTAKEMSYGRTTVKAPEVKRSRKPSHTETTLKAPNDDYYDYEAQYGDTAKEMSYGRTTVKALEVKRSRKPSHTKTTLKASSDDYYDYEAQYGDTAKEMSYGRTTTQAPQVKKSRKPIHVETSSGGLNGDYYSSDEQYGDTAKEMSYGHTTTEAPQLKNSRKPSHVEASLEGSNSDYYSSKEQYGDTAKEMSYSHTTSDVPQSKNSKKPSHVKTSLEGPNSNNYAHEATLVDTTKETPQVDTSGNDSHVETSLGALDILKNIETGKKVPTSGWNEIADELMNLVNNFFHRRGVDPLPLPGFEKSFKNLSWIKIYDGKLHGIAGVKRLSNITIEETALNLKLRLMIGIPSLTATYKFGAKFLGFTTKGDIEAKSSNISFILILEVDPRKMKIVIRDVGFQTIGNMGIKFKNVEYIGSILNWVTSLVLPVLKPIITDKLKVKLPLLLASIVRKLNKIISNALSALIKRNRIRAVSRIRVSKLGSEQKIMASLLSVAMCYKMGKCTSSGPIKCNCVSLNRLKHDLASNLRHQVQ